MGLIIAFAAGWVTGSRMKKQSLDDLLEAAKGVAGSEEFRDLLLAVRSHAASVLRELASTVDTTDRSVGVSSGTQDIVERVRQLLGREGPELQVVD